MDSEALDHMTEDSRFFTTFSPCREKWIVRIADGMQPQVPGIGAVKLAKNFTLHSMLFVPSLDCNMLSISELTQDYNCIIKFFKNLSEFQDLDSTKMIGSARKCLGLYLLTSNDSPSGQALAIGKLDLLSSFNASLDQIIKPWYGIFV